MGNLATAPEPQAPPAIVAVKELIRQQAPQIAAALPRHLSEESFTRIILTEVQRTPKLLQCDQMTLLGSLMLAAQLGLEPGQPLGLSYLIPYWNGKRKVFEAQFQIGAEGYRELVYRSGKVSTIQARIVYEKDDFEVSLGTNGFWRHKPSDEVSEGWTHVYAVAKLANGSDLFDYMSRAHVLHHRDRYAKGWDKPGSAWITNEAEMGRKTIMKRLAKQLPKSREVLQALVADESAPSMLTPDIAGALAYAERDLGEEMVADSEIIDVEAVEEPTTEGETTV